MSQLVRFSQTELDEIERTACKDSFYEFFLSFWSVVVQEELRLNWHIEYICNELQYIATFIVNRQKKPYDLAINVPPGSTKTTTVLQLFPAWLWCVDDTLRIISSSHSASISERSASKSRDIILSAKYRRLFPNVKLREDSNAKSVYTTVNGGNRHTTSTTGNATGDHAHIKLMDDLQEISKAGSASHRAQAIEHMKMLFTREVEKGNSVNILIMQRLHELDCTAYLNGLSSKRKIKTICLPAELSELVSPPELRGRYIDGLLDPIRMSRDILEEKKIELGTYGYQSQFMQEPTPPDGGMIKRNWFKVMPLNQFFRENSVFNFFVDTAYEKKKNIGKDGEAANDPTGLMCTVEQRGVVYIYDYREVYFEITELVPFIESWALSNVYSNLSKVMVEPKASGKSTVQTLRQNTKLNVCEITGGKDSKETELTNASPAIQSGRFVLIEGEWNRLFLDRVCGFPNAKHDEAVDLLCYAKKFYIDSNQNAINEALNRANAYL